VRAAVVVAMDVVEMMVAQEGMVTEGGVEMAAMIAEVVTDVVAATEIEVLHALKLLKQTSP